MIKKLLIWFWLMTAVVPAVAMAESSTGSGTEKEDLKEERVQFRDDIKTLREKKRTEFKERVQKLKDERKKQMITRINEKMAMMCKNREAMLSGHLARMTHILDRIEKRTTEAKGKGKDVSTVETALASARSAIQSAYTAVNSLATKQCGVTVTGNDSTLKAEAEAARKALEADVKAVQDKVKAARQAVEEVVKVLK